MNSTPSIPFSIHNPIPDAGEHGDLSAVENVDADHSTVSVIGWNIHGELSLLLRGPDLSFLDGYDIIYFCETWMEDDEHLALPVPPGFKFLSFPRPFSPHMRRQYMGGLAVMYRRSIALEIPETWVTTEYLAIELVDLVIVCAYIPPHGSPWLRTLEDNPHAMTKLSWLSVTSTPGRPPCRRRILTTVSQWIRLAMPGATGLWKCPGTSTWSS